MFIDKSSSLDEIVFNMHQELVKTAANKEVAQEEKLIKAASLLCDAAEILDETGLSKEAEIATALLEVVAGKKKKKKSKKSPSSEEMVDNYKEKGWAFNDANDKNSANDRNCAMCGSPKKDMNQVKEDEFQSLLDKLNTSSDFEDDWDIRLNEDPFADYDKTYVSNDRTFKIYWKGGKSEEVSGSGESKMKALTDAMANAGYGNDALAALDYWEEV